MLAALAIDSPTAPLRPDKGTKIAIRWRVSSVGSAVALGSGVGPATGSVVAGPVLGMT